MTPKKILSPLFVCLGFAPACAQTPPPVESEPEPSTSQRYLGQKPPSREPELFAPDLVSKPDRHEFGSTFSADGLEFFFSVSLRGRSETYSMTFEDDDWGPPQKILSHETFGFNDPILTPKGDRLYFISNRPHDDSTQKRDHDIWYVEREENGWSAPINAGPAINSPREEYYISFTTNGDLYFGSNVEAPDQRRGDFDLYVSRFEDGVQQPRQRLLGDINTTAYEADVFVAPDGSYAIFSAERPDGLGRGDLYISFAGEDGSWSEAKNLGAPFNGRGHELCPFVTADGKYFFYTSNGDIYWVDASVLEAYR